MHKSKEIYNNMDNAFNGTKTFQSGMNLFLSRINSFQFKRKIMAKYYIPWNNSTLATLLWKILSGSRTIYSL